MAPRIIVSEYLTVLTVFSLAIPQCGREVRQVLDLCVTDGELRLGAAL